MVDAAQNTTKPNEQFKNYQIVNNLPDKQALVLQNTDAKMPIQIKINQDTDYASLLITLIVALVSSIVSAWITIKLVTKSNDKLVTNQSEISDNQLEYQNKHQRNEITSKNRQEWINTVRILISEYLSCAGQLLINLMKSENYRIVCKKDEKFIPDFKSYSEIMRANYSSLHDKAMLIDLILSKDNPLDREIVKLIKEIDVAYIQLSLSIQSKIDNKLISPSLEFSHLNTHPETNIILVNRATIANKTKELLKNEWERVKNLT